jgi:hypothetical protein
MYTFTDLKNRIGGQDGCIHIWGRRAHRPAPYLGKGRRKEVHIDFRHRDAENLYGFLLLPSPICGGAGGGEISPQKVNTPVRTDIKNKKSNRCIIMKTKILIFEELKHAEHGPKKEFSQQCASISGT